MKITARAFDIGDKVVICEWDAVVKAIEEEKDKNWFSVKRRLQAAHIYGGKVANVRAFGTDVLDRTEGLEVISVYQLADESGAIIPFAFMDCMLTRCEPSNAETKCADGAAEEKSTDRPQILKGDIVRVVEKIADIPGAEWENRHFVSDVKWDGVFSDKLDFYYNTDIIAIYRFDGRDFKCIWESEERNRRKQER